MAGELCSPAFLVRSHRPSPIPHSLVKLLQQVPRNHNPLYLRRSLADLADLCVTHESLDRIVLGVAVAAMYLDGFDRRAHRQLRAEELRDRRFLAERLSMLREPRRMEHQMST